MQQPRRWNQPPTSFCNLHIDAYDGEALIGGDSVEMTSSQTVIRPNMVSEGDKRCGPVGSAQTVLIPITALNSILPQNCTQMYATM